MSRLFLLTACLSLAGCGGGDFSQNRPTPARSVRVDWLGHESFRFRSSLGTQLITNPYETGAIGRAFPKGQRPDIVLISHERSDANNINAFDNSPTVFRGAVGIGSNSATGIRIRGVPSNKEETSGDPLGMNLVYSWQLDGVRFCFTGNIENVLSAPEVLHIGRVDVLFLPVGVPRGLTRAERDTIIRQLRPRVIVPMGRADAFSRWATGFTRVHQLPGSSVLFSRDTLPPEPIVLIFNAPGR